MSKRFGDLVFWWFSVLGNSIISNSWECTEWRVFFLVIGFFVPIAHFVFVPSESFLLILSTGALTYLAIGSLAHLFLEWKTGESPIFE